MVEVRKTKLPGKFAEQTDFKTPNVLLLLGLHKYNTIFFKHMMSTHQVMFNTQNVYRSCL